MKTHAAHKFFLFTAMALLATAGLARTQDNYQTKAAHVAKLARYCEWPKEKTAAGILVIGIFGSEAASEQIREVIGGRKINNREVVVKPLTAVQEIAGCHILFVSRTEEARYSSILGKARSESVLAVGESELFLKKGGIINLRSDGTAVSLEINVKNARRADLTLSPRLLELSEGAVGG